MKYGFIPGFNFPDNPSFNRDGKVIDTKSLIEEIFPYEILTKENQFYLPLFEDDFTKAITGIITRYAIANNCSDNIFYVSKGKIKGKKADKAVMYTLAESLLGSDDSKLFSLFDGIDDLTIQLLYYVETELKVKCDVYDYVRQELTNFTEAQKHWLEDAERRKLLHV